MLGIKPGPAIFLDVSMAGSYETECQISEERKRSYELDAELIDKTMMHLNKQYYEPKIKEKEKLDGYVIRYFDAILDDNVEEWVSEDKVTPLEVAELKKSGKTKNLTKDWLGQVVNIGDYVVSYNYLYKIEKLSAQANYIKARIISASKVRSLKTLYSKDFVRIETSLGKKKEEEIL